MSTQGNLSLRSGRDVASKVELDLVGGDIAQVQSDVMITAINSGGMWFGAIDGVIQRVAGMQFHNQAAAASPLRDGQTIVARRRTEHRGAFGDVVFVVDDLKRPLNEVVLAGLLAADAAGYKAVTLPAIRLGVMLGVVEKSIQEAVDLIGRGVRTFIESNPTSVQSLTFVIYRDERATSLLAPTLKALPGSSS